MANKQVTPHAIRRYRERIVPDEPASPPESVAMDLLRSLERPLFAVPGPRGCMLLGCRNRRGFMFLALLLPDGITVDSCGPYWFWHEARPAWRRLGFGTKKGLRRRKA